jgi:type VI secretion system secreted protein VgrG
MATPGMIVELSVDGHPPSLFRVARFEGEERLSSPGALTVDANTEQAVDPDELVDRRAELTVELWGTKRRFQGIVTEADLEMVREDVFAVRVTIAPKLAVLDLGRSSRIFQEQSVKEIVSAVLHDSGVERAAWKLSETHPKRAFVAQHQESDLAFLGRLLSEEGIGFAVTGGEDGEEISLFDDSTRASPIDGETTLYDRTAVQAATEAVWEVSERRRTASDAVVLKDYDLRRPQVDLTAKKEAPDASGREIYLHPGGYAEEPEGKRRARACLEAIRAGTHGFHGRASCLRLAPGRTFTMQASPDASANCDHFVVAVRHRGFTQEPRTGSTWAYENEFDSIRADMPWRPSLQPSGPVRGPQVAAVTAPPGQEIHCDEYGRVKVRFLWERRGPADDRSSQWLRVSQIPLGGSLVLPRAGFEVLVDFEQGDLDRPFVAGHLYNGESKPPYDLPGAKTRSSFQSATTSGGGGANELRFEDSAGSEEILLNASKDLSVSAHDDASATVGNDRKASIGASRKLVVGQDHLANVKADRKLTVAANLDLKVTANLTDGVGGSESVSVGGMRKVDVGGDKVGSIKGSFARKVGALQATTAIIGVQRKTVGSSEMNVAAAWAEMVAGSRKSDCGGNRTETTGAVKVVKAKQMKVSAGTNLVVTVAGALSTKAGGSRSDSAGRALALSSGAGLSVKAQTILIEAKKALLVRAGSVSFVLLSAGLVLVKAKEIDLRGVKKLAQVIHQSN